jgi:hypothetical protein
MVFRDIVFLSVLKMPYDLDREGIHSVVAINDLDFSPKLKRTLQPRKRDFLCAPIPPRRDGVSARL